LTFIVVNVIVNKYIVGYKRYPTWTGRRHE
jgi:hypothetical protein